MIVTCRKPESLASRSPHGERGLKSHFLMPDCCNKPSLSSWRAWIEILLERYAEISQGCRSPHGERGLKSLRINGKDMGLPSRSPHGERGLKFREIW